MELISKLLSFVPDKLLNQLAVSAGVDKYAKKLQGELIFKLLVYCMVTEKDNSLRGMQSALESAVFQALAGNSYPGSISYSSISERLSKIKWEYFQQIFNACVSAYGAALGNEKRDIIRFDSTIVSLSGKLLQIGYNLKGGRAEKHRLLKYTIGFTNIPEVVYFYSDQTHNSENVALSESIIAHNMTGSRKINVFDRGITSRDNYDKLTEDKIHFISRINNDAKQTVYKNNTIAKSISSPTLNIISDSWVYLYTMYSKRSKYPVRLIKAVRKENKEPLTFITNIKAINAKEVTEVYKSRWDIEVFFKFIKQNLNFNHLINRTESGIRSVLYITMTVAILLEKYKREKKLKGFKIAKQKFSQELERDIIYRIVILCGGDIQKAKKVLFQNSS
jgi:Transposase DDE domain